MQHTRPSADRPPDPAVPAGPLPAFAPTWRASVSVSGPAQQLIASVLGPGQAKENEVVWRVSAFGRPCLVYLHSWASGPQTVTTLDSARPAHSMVRHFEVNSVRSLEDLERELKTLTTPASETTEASALRPAPLEPIDPGA